MPRSSMLTRLKGLLYPFMNQNEVSDAVLTGPADVLGQLDGVLEVYLLDGRYLEPGTVTLTQGTTTITQVPDAGLASVDWTTRFKVGDDIVVGGSLTGQSARYQVATVAAQSLTITGAPFATTESGLVYAKSTFELWRRAKELGVYPGGYESDTALRANVLARWLTIQQMRGTRGGLKDEINRVCNATANILESIVALETLAVGLAYTAATKTLANTGGWATGLPIGTPLTIINSATDANGRYTIVGVSGGNPIIGHRASRSRFYPYVAGQNAVDVQLREDRELNQLWMRLVNTTGVSQTVEFTLTATNGTFTSGALTSGAGTVGVTPTVATITLTAAAGQTTEVRLLVSGFTVGGATPTTLVVHRVSGAPTGVRVGELGLYPKLTGSGAIDTSQDATWLWGGMVATGLRWNHDATNLTVLSGTKPGWYLNVSYPGVIEEDAYTMASPDEFVVIEVDHRNRANYSDDDLKTLVGQVFLPADVDGVLGLL